LGAVFPVPFETRDPNNYKQFFIMIQSLTKTGCMIIVGIIKNTMRAGVAQVAHCFYGPRWMPARLFARSS
jgi:hypothetical protein